MNCVLTGYDGAQYALPAPLEWRFRYGSGTPCDSFELVCPWGPGLDERLSAATRFWAEEDGERRFTGVVDEYACTWDGRGGTLAISGRGLAALLLDNEAVGQEYQVATLDDILRDHVAPYGIETAARVPLPAVAGFAPAAGSSEWQVLYDFARYHGGVEPRFDRLGRLVVAPWPDGARRVLDARTGCTEISFRDRRYGVLSEVLVRDRATLAVQRVADGDFLGQGGMCRRVLTMPGRSSYQAMRYSGAYQLSRSAEGRHRLEVRVPGAFCAWPGEVFEVRLERPRIGGAWRVLESTAACGAQGASTRLSFGKC